MFYFNTQDEAEQTGSTANDDESEDKETESQALPVYQVEVPDAEKRGENVMFTLHTVIPATQKGFVVLRQFEDIEWLHHNLVTANNIDGVIVS